MKILNVLLSFTICLFSMGCEESINKTLLTQDTNLLVVEGIITNEKINHLVKLSIPYKTQNETPIPVSGAAVQITEENNTYPLTESPIGSGQYYTAEMRAVIGKIYTLHIQYNGKEYIAQDYSVPVEPLQAPKYTKADNQYSLDLNTSGQDANYINHDISWANTTACLSGSACTGRIVFYDLKTTDVNEIYKPKKEAFSFPSNTTIIRKKYSISPSYKSFLRAMLSETEWRGGVFDIQRADVPTNLSVGAIGFFAVSTVVSDTVIVSN